MASDEISVFASSDDRGPLRGRLAARTLGQLGFGEQFVVWALRQRLHDGEPGSAVLVHGFRLAFGLWALEPALAAFEGCFSVLARHALHDLCFCPLRCACLSLDENAILELIAAAQLAPGGACLAPALERLVEPEGCAPLRGNAMVLGTILLRAGLLLPAPARRTGGVVGPVPLH
jgi:hypothetical protein